MARSKKVEDKVVGTASEAPLTPEQRIDALTRDIQELGRGVNAQAKLLESIVTACDSVIKKYIELTKVPDEPAK